MKWKITFWTLAIVFLPFGFCWTYDALTGLLRGDLNTALSLYLSLVGIMVTSFLTWYIYRIERRREEKAAAGEEQAAKRTVAALLRAGVFQAIFRTGAYIQISDEVLRQVTPASRSLSLEQMTELTTVMKTLQSIGDAELKVDRWEAGEAADRFTQSFLPPPVALFRERMLEVSNWEWLVEEPVRGLLAALGTPLANRPSVCIDANGQPVFQALDKGRYRLWTQDGRMILDGVVRCEEVEDGYAELSVGSDRFYCGNFKDGRYHGHGVEFFSDIEGGVVSKEGEWADGKLVNGIIYQAVLDDPTDDDEEEGEPYAHSPFEFLCQLSDPEAVRLNADCMLPFHMCNLKVTNGVPQVIEESVQTVEEFCEHWQPRTMEAPFAVQQE